MFKSINLSKFLSDSSAAFLLDGVLIYNIFYKKLKSSEELSFIAELVLSEPLSLNGKGVVTLNHDTMTRNLIFDDTK